LGIALKGKMHSVLKKIPGLNCLKLIRDILCGIKWGNISG
jgi:hypothetical protein